MKGYVHKGLLRLDPSQEQSQFTVWANPKSGEPGDWIEVEVTQTGACSMSAAIVFKSFRFEAAHWLPGVVSGHKCSRMHGHSYKVVVGVQGEIDSVTGMVIDFDSIKHHVKPLVDSLDHRCLNEIDGLDNPTSENLCVWFWGRLFGQVVGLKYVEVWETETCGSRVEA